MVISLIGLVQWVIAWDANQIVVPFPYPSERGLKGEDGKSDNLVCTLFPPQISTNFLYLIYNIDLEYLLVLS